jgi:hypothetical protein
MSGPLQATIGILLAAGISAATAAPAIPSSEMPGRERDRFTDSPVERFMQPGPYQTPPVIEPTEPQCKNQKPAHSKSRSTKHLNCW